MRTWRPVLDDEADAMMIARSRGATHRQIAAQFGRPRSTVDLILRRQRAPASYGRDLAQRRQPTPAACEKSRLLLGHSSNGQAESASSQDETN